MLHVNFNPSVAKQLRCADCTRNKPIFLYNWIDYCAAMWMIQTRSAFMRKSPSLLPTLGSEVMRP